MTFNDTSMAGGKPARAAAGSFNTLVKLRPWTEYTFQVTAQNSLGESKRSDFTRQTCVTPQAKPARNPLGVCTDLRDNMTLNITWEVSFEEVLVFLNK